MIEPTCDYIRREFLTIEELANQAQTTAAVILELIDAQCVPRWSYEIVETAHVESFFGDREVSRQVTRYFAKTQVKRICELLVQAKESNLDSIARCVKSRFCTEYRSEIVACDAVAAGLMDSAEMSSILDSEWNEWLRGTYGLCTKQDHPKNIARKELSIRRIKQITQDGTRKHLSRRGREILEDAVRELDEVTSHFAPDERQGSSREKWIDRISQKYQLRVETVPAGAQVD